MQRNTDSDGHVSNVLASTVVVSVVSRCSPKFRPLVVRFNILAVSGAANPSADPIRQYLFDFDGDG